MADSRSTGLVVGQLEGHSLVHLRIAGGDRTMCARTTSLEWPSKNFRTSGCLTCHAQAIEHGYRHALDTDGTWLDLDQLADRIDQLTETWKQDRFPA